MGSWVLSLVLAALPQVGEGSIADYFPLEVGNQWIYEQSGRISGQTIVVEVLDSEWIEGYQYALLAGIAREGTWVRVSDEGILLNLDRASGREAVWADFSATAGQEYSTEFDPCSPRARVVSRSATIQVPVGEFENALAVGYPMSFCADAGLESDYFVPGVGLVEHTQLTIAGPSTLSLIYARIRGVTVLSRPEVAFGLSLDQGSYTTRLTSPVLSARIALRVTQPEPLELTFPTGQRFEFEIRDESGQLVYRWSDGMAFTLAFGTESFGPGETNWLVRVPLTDALGNLLDPGAYEARAWLTTEGASRFSASVIFDILSDRASEGTE